MLRNVYTCRVLLGFFCVRYVARSGSALKDQVDSYFGMSVTTATTNDFALMMQHQCIAKSKEGGGEGLFSRFPPAERILND